MVVQLCVLLSHLGCVENKGKNEFLRCSSWQWSWRSLQSLLSIMKMDVWWMDCSMMMMKMMMSIKLLLIHSTDFCWGSTPSRPQLLILHSSCLKISSILLFTLKDLIFFRKYSSCWLVCESVCLCVCLSVNLSASIFLSVCLSCNLSGWLVSSLLFIIKSRWFLLHCSTDVSTSSQCCDSC